MFRLVCVVALVLVASGCICPDREPDRGPDKESEADLGAVELDVRTEWSLDTDSPQVELVSREPSTYRVTNEGRQTVRLTYFRSGRVELHASLGPGLSMDLGLQDGDRIQLEQVDGSASGTCLRV